MTAAASGAGGRWNEVVVRADPRHFDRLAEGVLAPLFQQLHEAAPSRRAYYLWEEPFFADRPASLRIRAEAPASEFPLRAAADLCVLRAGLGAGVEDGSEAEPVYHTALLTGASARGLLDDFYSDTNALVLECALDGGTLARRRLFGLDLLAAEVELLAASFPADDGEGRRRFLRLFGEFAEFFCYQSRDPAAARRLLAGRLGQVAESVAQRVNAPPAEPRLAQWSQCLRSYLERVSAGLSSGALAPIEDDGTVAGVSRHDDGRRFAAGVHGRRAQVSSLDFHSTRILVSFGLWTLVRLGIPIVDRYFLCYALGSGASALPADPPMEPPPAPPLSWGPLRHVKPAVRALRAPAPPVPAARVKLDQNENPFELPEPLKRRVLERALARPWARYPDLLPAPFLARLARHAGWRSEGVLAGNGSSELIEALLLATVGEGTPVVIPEPTFGLYGHLASVLGGRVRTVPLDGALRYDVRALCRARRESGAAVTVVCSPNNPTGSALGLDELEALCEEGDGLVVVDEAYGEYAGLTAVPLLERHPNLVVLRTFSKALALAGLRVGYLLAAPELVRELNKARRPFNLNFLSQLAAEAALDEYPLVELQVARLVEQRKHLGEALARIPGVRPYPSLANFILVELEDADARAVHAALAAEGILVLDVTGYPRLGRHLRVTVGSPEQGTALLEALPRALAAGREAPARRH